MAFTTSSIPEERVYKGNVFPLTLSCTESKPSITSMCEWLQENAHTIDKLLLKHKGILFRCGSAVPSHVEFHSFVEALNYKQMDYVGGAAVRTQLTSRVFTANESPSSEPIPFHHEMAQTPHPPTHLLFYCETAPTSGGATPILVSAEVCDRLNELHPDFMRDLEQCGVRYVRYLSEQDDPTSAIGRGWRSTFQCSNREGAEAALVALGSEWRWQEDGTLQTITATVPAIRTDDQPPEAERSEQKTFFNSVVAAYTGWNDSRNDGSRAVVLGEGVQGNSAQGKEGQVMPPQAIADAVRVMQEVCVAFPWLPGDVLLLDNRTVMHSRQPFSGPRRILASLARDPLR